MPADSHSKRFPAKDGLPEVFLSEAGISPSSECGKCHKDIYASWKNSLHSMSISDPVFWSSYLQAYYEDSEKARKVCLGCHAPLTGINNDYGLEQEITREGINCDFCHTISEVIDGKKGRFTYRHEFGLLVQGPLRNIKSSVHRIRYNKLYKESRFCAGCHEYTNGNGIKLLETFS
ncbi:MAG: multiheme c-type cytochrome [Nitrospinota bacterium]